MQLLNMSPEYMVVFGYDMLTQAGALCRPIFVRGQKKKRVSFGGLIAAVR